MKNLPKFVFAATAALLVSPDAMAQNRATYESMVASHAAANNVPVALVHRVIVRESKYHPALVGRGGTIGLMQIKLPTARGLGYTGDAAGLRDPDTNLAWGVKYLAGAYRAANGDHGRAVRYYASGYYYAAKRQRQEQPVQLAPVLASSAPPKIVARPAGTAKTPTDANAMQTSK
jgi:soluble lytic murein transglycosylase-like protein